MEVTRCINFPFLFAVILANDKYSRDLFARSTRSVAELLAIKIILIAGIEPR